jgi:DNA-binding Lrp family transcriptional regulator
MIEVLRKLNQLKKEGVIRDYAIGGGYAVNYYLEPILTYDLDIFVLMSTDKEYSALYQYFRNRKYKIENVYIIIEGMPVQFLPSFVSTLIDEAIRRAKSIRVKGIPSKVLTVEYLIATLLMAFRPKDKMVIPHLLEQADTGLLKEIVGRFSDEKAPLDKRLGRILESLQ